MNPEVEHQKKMTCKKKIIEELEKFVLYTDMFMKEFEDARVCDEKKKEEEEEEERGGNSTITTTQYIR